MSQPLPITVLLSEHEIANKFADALATGYLGEQFFYWLPLSVEAWVALGSSPEYRNADRALTLLHRSAPGLRELWPTVDLICGLGCGEGSKDRVLLDVFRPRSYIGVDFSQSLLELALTGAFSLVAELHGFKLDIASDQHLFTLGEAVQRRGASALYTILGNTLGAFGPNEFPSRIRKLMCADDRVLFDGEIFAGEETLRGYDHPVNRRFAFAPLASLGLTESDGVLKFELRSRSSGVHEVAKYFVPKHDLKLNIAGRDVSLPNSKQLRMSSSLKYDEPALYELVERGGFKIEFSDRSDDGRFLLFGARPDSM